MMNLYKIATTLFLAFNYIGAVRFMADDEKSYSPQSMDDLHEEELEEIMDFDYKEDDKTKMLGIKDQTTSFVPGEDLGRTNFGEWTGFSTCPKGKKITGFRMNVEEYSYFIDNTGLNKIQFMCEGGTKTEELGKTDFGEWASWVNCNRREYVTEIDLKAEKDRGIRDDYGATNFKITCSGGDTLEGEGIEKGLWVGPATCPSGHYICGANVKAEGGVPHDKSALNRVKLACCPSDTPSTGDFAGPILGNTYWGGWTGFARCPDAEKIVGFKLRIESYHSRLFSDNTGLNDILLRCQGGAETASLGLDWGDWTEWTLCDGADYMTALDVKSESDRGDHRDDVSVTNVRMKCIGQEEKVGDGWTRGGDEQWVGYKSCPHDYYICGARAQVEGKGGDDTALNRIQLYCCHEPKVETTAAPIITTTPAPIFCSNAVNVGFLLDASASLRGGYFPREKEFLKKVADYFNVQQDGSRASVITFSDHAELSVKFKDGTKKNKFNGKVDKIRFFRRYTRIDLALRLAQRQMFTKENGMKEGLPKVLFLLTDGEQSMKKEHEDPVTVAQELREDGVVVVAVGIGDSINRQQLEKIAGDKDHTFCAKNFNEMEGKEFLHHLQRKGCELSLS